ncbi:hypothetical protein RFI_08662 [Reticulomyxa filosa]|uniref:Uncharacterized protein n=1 Tax=Reticulomyxa filosa TaxID=46433 RepID=X6NR46_RETFI|nr:hypothetical protein RFI_08662 [Reticulomyxa filosa]|eukprot:ETO28471.1 hypothetical protein RFI_08662 [Reticulomyxa filosa]
MFIFNLNWSTIAFQLLQLIIFVVRTVESQQHLIDELTLQNKELKGEIEKLKEQVTSSTKSQPAPATTATKTPTPNNGGGGGGGIDNGVSQNAAASMLAAKLGGMIKRPLQSANVNASATASTTTTAATTGTAATTPSKSTNEDSSNLTSGAEEDGTSSTTPRLEPDHERILKKYEMMLKLGISVHGAIGRMTQDGIDKDIIKQFKIKHAGFFFFFFF